VLNSSKPPNQNKTPESFHFYKVLVQDFH